ncbi:hypothetical protein LSH36_250g03073 [Paralvinella palmiformis]|uniref:WD repeat-containing protein 89 n=1 Tax=Paralvinella palmiformis TaxID=53620 RepID=A0AAD9JL25_9ANNE|nr:hypothetical protein LSH36_250g03073 [Paralvinella palmiformis]
MSSSVSRGQHLQASGMVITLGFYGPNVPLTELEMAWIILPKDSRCVYIKTQTGAIHDNHNYHASTTIRKGGVGVDYLVDCFQTSADDLYLLTGSFRGDMSVFSVTDDAVQPCFSLPKAHSGVIRCINWDEMTQSLVTGGEDSMLCLWKRELKHKNKRKAEMIYLCSPEVKDKTSFKRIYVAKSGTSSPTEICGHSNGTSSATEICGYKSGTSSATAICGHARVVRVRLRPSVAMQEWYEFGYGHLWPCKSGTSSATEMRFACAPGSVTIRNDYIMPRANSSSRYLHDTSYHFCTTTPPPLKNKTRKSSSLDGLPR